MKQLTALKTTLEEKLKEVQNQGKQAISEAFVEFFEKCPDVEAVRWSQYAPYFNDGDACEFSVHELEVRLKDEEDFADQWSLNYELNKSKHGGAFNREVDVEHPVVKILEPISDALQSSAMSSTMEAIFGNHVQVTVTRDGMEIDEHDHD
jgi:hypothetical protein